MDTNKHKLGVIQYYFKGLKINEERSFVKFDTSCLITVERKQDNRLIDFVFNSGKWLLKSALNKTNPLYGTCFVFNKSENF